MFKTQARLPKVNVEAWLCDDEEDAEQFFEADLVDFYYELPNKDAQSFLECWGHDRDRLNETLFDYWVNWLRRHGTYLRNARLELFSLPEYLDDDEVRAIASTVPWMRRHYCIGVDDEDTQNLVEEWKRVPTENDIPLPLGI